MKKAITITILILCIFLFLKKKNQENGVQDDIIFFKIFSLGQEKHNEPIQVKAQTQEQHPQYIFSVTYKNTDFKEIQLCDTIEKETLIREKIAPGTKGKFEILLETTQTINYEIQFKSKNEKPKNLTFQIEGQDKKYETLEDLQENLKGEISQNKSIVINWQWDYEANNSQNLQDTKDGKNLRQYNFTIYAIGK